MGADRLIYIRTDGNSKIAAGHLVRCLSIAQNCLKIGMSVCFLLSDEESRNLLDGFMTEDLKQNPNLSVQILKTAKYDDPEKELPEVLALLAAEGTTALSPAACPPSLCPSKDFPHKRNIFLLDSYFVTEKYLTEIGSVAKIAYLDDLQLFDYPVDLIINYDVIPDAVMPSYEAAYSKAGKALLGAAYTPLRSQFANKVITVRETASDILVTTGGSDPYHFCVEFIREYIRCFSGSPFSDTTDSTPSDSSHKTTAGVPDGPIADVPTLHIVIGRLSEDKEMLYALAKEYSFIKPYENITDMAALMSTCDLAVSAAGTTLYELCALGVPTVSFTMADNQLVAAKAFDEAGAIPCAGDIRQDKELMLDKIFDFILGMTGATAPLAIPQTSDSDTASYHRRLQAHQAMHRLADGGGAARIAKELAQL